jgi:multidrug resistance efflux pump
VTIRPLALLLALACLAPFAGAAEEAAPPRTVEATAGPFAIVVELEGTLVPRESVEVSVEPRVYGGKLEVTTAFAGGEVEKGQLLVAFATDEIDREIDDKRRALELAEIKLGRQEEEWKRKEEALSIELAQAEIRLRDAAEELELFRTVHKPLRIETAEFGLQSQEDRIQDEMEEFAQLEKMYKADDLTEETEEIVLRRARRGLERSHRSMEFARRRHTLFMDVTLPREEEALELGLRKTENEVEGIRVRQELSLKQARAELDKARVELDRQRVQLADLKADREALRVKAPAAGYAVPGAFQGGKWQKVAETRRSLVPGARVGARQTLFTIVQRGDVRVVGRAEEKDLLGLTAGQDVRVTAPLTGDREFPGRVTAVDLVGEGGKHEVEIDLRETDRVLLPGYTVKARVDVRRVDRAVTVPKGAVRTQGDEHHVFLWSGSAPEPRAVKIGVTSKGRVEILEGLEAGERILEKAPKE